MLVEVKRFHRHAHRLLADAGTRSPVRSSTLGEFLTAGRYSPYFVHHFMVPLVSCVWSCPPRTALRYPARSLFTFFEHHGALSVSGSPQWRTVVGGSRSYVERAAKELTATELSTPVRCVRRVAASPSGHGAGGSRSATTPTPSAPSTPRSSPPTPTTRSTLLADATPAERAALGAFPSSVNETILHTDGSVLPRQHRARASWNYLLDRCASDAPRCTSATT